MDAEQMVAAAEADALQEHSPHGQEDQMYKGDMSEATSASTKAMADEEDGEDCAK